MSPKVRFNPVYGPAEVHEALLAAADKADKKYSEWMLEALQKALQEELEPEPTSPPPNTVTIQYEPDQYEQLAALAQDLGMEEIEKLLRHMSRRALKVRPRELHTFLYGDFFKDGEDAYDQKKAELEGKRKKGTTKAANDKEEIAAA